MAKKYWCGNGEIQSKHHEWGDWQEGAKPRYIVSGCTKCPALRVVSTENIDVVDATEFYRE